MNQSLAQLIETNELPSPPGVAFRLLELYDNEDVEIEEISKIISADPVLASKLINFCNSPLMGRAMLVDSVNQAVVAIGLRAVKMISLSFSLMQTPERKQTQTSFDYPRFWNRSLATAISARTVSTHVRGDSDACFLMGLMLNIGQLAIGHAVPQEYQDATEEAKKAGQSLVEMELQRWDFERYEMGGQLLKKWKFPPEMADMICNCNKPIASEQRQNSESILTLELADQMAELLFQEEVQGDLIDLMKANAKSKLNIEEDVFDELFNDFVSAWSQYAKVLSYDCSHEKTFDELESQARRGIAELSMGLHAENIRITEENQQLQTNAFMDVLTGLKNRRAYNKEAAAEAERCKRSGRMFVMMVLDIDHFKSVNDRFGHDAGDTILISVAATLVDHTRKYDSVFRIGGEEFVVILADCDPQAIETAAERFRTAIEKLDHDIDGENLKVTVSIGIACCAAATRTTQEIFKEADNALYDAKEQGRNRCCFRLQSSANESPTLPPMPTPNSNAAASHSVAAK